jgi:hypothetical protein
MWKMLSDPVSAVFYRDGVRLIHGLVQFDLICTRGKT